MACFRTNPKDVPVDSLFAGNFEQRRVRRRLPPPPPTLPRTNRAWRTCHCAGLSGVYGAFLKRPLPVLFRYPGIRGAFFGNVSAGRFRVISLRPRRCSSGGREAQDAALFGPVEGKFRDFAQTPGRQVGRLAPFQDGRRDVGRE